MQLTYIEHPLRENHYLSISYDRCKLVLLSLWDCLNDLGVHDDKVDFIIKQIQAQCVSETGKYYKKRDSNYHFLCLSYRSEEKIFLDKDNAFLHLNKIKESYPKIDLLNNLYEQLLNATKPYHEKIAKINIIQLVDFIDKEFLWRYYEGQDDKKAMMEFFTNPFSSYVKNWDEVLDEKQNPKLIHTVEDFELLTQTRQYVLFMEHEESHIRGYLKCEKGEDSYSASMTILNEATIFSTLQDIYDWEYLLDDRGWTGYICEVNINLHQKIEILAQDKNYQSLDALFALKEKEVIEAAPQQSDLMKALMNDLSSDDEDEALLKEHIQTLLDKKNQKKQDSLMGSKVGRKQKI